MGARTLAREASWSEIARRRDPGWLPPAEQIARAAAIQAEADRTVARLVEQTGWAAWSSNTAPLRTARTR